VTVAARLSIGVLSILENDEEEKEQFEAVRNNNDCEHQKGDAAAAVDGVSPPIRFPGAG
jgi:hypothetical protein